MLAKPQATVQNLYDLKSALHSMLNLSEIKTYSGQCHVCHRFIEDHLFIHLQSEHKLGNFKRKSFTKKLYVVRLIGLFRC